MAMAISSLTMAMTPLCAQTYPVKPIRIICPAAPGGISDILSRIAAFIDMF